MASIAALGLALQSALGASGPSGGGGDIDLLKSAVVAAIITAGVAGVGVFVTSQTSRAVNREKMDLDRQLAERRYELDQLLAEQRSAADLALAERRAVLEREVALAKRRAEIAEVILAEFYEVRKVFDSIRSPMIWAYEMVEEEGVDEELIRNDGYGVIRRVRKHEALFARLETHRFVSGALFGTEAIECFNKVIQAHNRLMSAAENLVRWRKQSLLGTMDEFLAKNRQLIFRYPVSDEAPADEITELLDQAVRDIETICRPALTSWNTAS